MPIYDEFRLVLTPDLNTLGQWNVHLAACPIGALVGPKGSVIPSLTRDQLKRLRSRHGWPNLAHLLQIGSNVWKSVLTPQAEAALEACLVNAKQTERHLRIVLVTQGQESDGLPPDIVRLAELPVETLYKDTHSFLATNLVTPISRSFQFQPDREPYKVALPLRILVVVATPTDKPSADVLVEAQTLRDALGPHEATGTLKLDFCDPPTRLEFGRRLMTQTYHIVHFIGHGGFDIVGDDPTLRAHLCFVRSDEPISDPMDAFLLSEALRNTSVRLVVITACSSAAATPDQEPYSTSAFEGVAQRLFSLSSDVSGAVAMQFDMEGPAAVTFTRTFYEYLLNPSYRLDEAVTLARRQLMLQLDAGHRAWVTPAVFWRCHDAQVFDLIPMLDKLDDATRAELNLIEAQQKVYRQALEVMQRQPTATRQAVTPLLRDYQQELKTLEHKQGQLLGETVRLWGGSAQPGKRFESRLTLRLRLLGRIDLVQVTFRYPTGHMTFERMITGEHFAGPPPTTVESAVGLIQVTLPIPSGDQEWYPGEYEVGRLQFQLPAGTQPSIADLQIVQVGVWRGGRAATFQPLSGVVFIDDAEPIPPRLPFSDEPTSMRRNIPISDSHVAASGSRSEPSSDSFVDVCIVCALAEEAQAFLHVVEEHYHLSWTNEINHQYGYDYRLITLPNVEGEALRVHVSWLPRTGLQEALLHLSHVIEEYQPRFAAMTGICAGDKRHVNLGDLVVAERTFTYDSGKVVRDEHGQTVHQHDTITYQVHENTLRFILVFDDWRPRVAALSRPISKRQQRDWLLQRLFVEPTGSVQAIPLPELNLHAPAWRQLIHELQQGPEPFLLPELVLRDKTMIDQLRYGLLPFPSQDPSEAHCHMRPMASGSAVRSDDPFKEIQVPVRGAVAIDIEGAAFGRVMESFSGIKWLIVKGVSDYADSDKDDSYHLYAANASAMYMLRFLETYVTQRRLPIRRSGHNASRDGPSPVWNIPYPRNPFFTGRDDVLTHLHTQFQAGQLTTLSQPQAISGLGGIGKTQIALEYAYHYRQDYQALFWVRAESTEALNSSYNELATLLNLPQKDAQEQEAVVQAVKIWLRAHQGWLLILDNANEPNLLPPFLPPTTDGHILLTTRTTDLGGARSRSHTPHTG